MNQSRAELKAKLVREYAALLDDVLPSDEACAGQTLEAIEDQALDIRAEVGRQVTVALVELNSGQSVPGPRCERCGQEMHYKGRKHRYVRTRSGDIQFERAYYYCRACGRGIFPP